MCDPVVGFGGAVGFRMRSLCQLSGMPLGGFSGSKLFGLVRPLDRSALAAAVAPEEPNIAPPVRVSQVESLALRMQKPCRPVQPNY